MSDQDVLVAVSVLYFSVVSLAVSVFINYEITHKYQKKNAKRNHPTGDITDKTGAAERFFERAYAFKEAVRRREAGSKVSIHDNAFFDARRFHHLVPYSGYNTTFTEIDEVIVSRYGIFCIEEKSHTGYVFGDAAGKYWTQCRYDRKSRLFNPIWQNYKHIKALEIMLGRNLKEPIHSYVIFTNAKKIMVNDNRVLKGKHELVEMLLGYDKPVYTEQEFAKICHILKYAESISMRRFPQHVVEAKAYVAAMSA